MYESLPLVMSLLGIVFSLLLGVIGFFTKRLLTDVDKMSEELHELKLEIARTYATKSEVYSALRDGFDRLEKIIDEVRKDVKNLLTKQ